MISTISHSSNTTTRGACRIIEISIEMTARFRHKVISVDIRRGGGGGSGGGGGGGRGGGRKFTRSPRSKNGSVIR